MYWPLKMRNTLSLFYLYLAGSSFLRNLTGIVS
jgi:hypothetical protein